MEIAEETLRKKKKKKKGTRQYVRKRIEVDEIERKRRKMTKRQRQGRIKKSGMRFSRG